MTTKNAYWLVDPEGVYALVEGAEQRNVWTQVHGWTEAAEPRPTDQVHVVNENPEIGPGRLPYAAVELHAGRGWMAGPPPAPANTTKDPVFVDQAAEPVAAPVKPKTQAAATADTVKE